MLAPLLLVWPISIVITYGFAETIANRPFDHALEDQVNAMASLVRYHDGRVSAVLPNAARVILRADDTDTVYFQVRDNSSKVVAGDEFIPAPDADSLLSENIRFRDLEIKDQRFRVAYVWLAVGPKTPKNQAYALIQVAETLNKRTQLATDIIKGVIVPQFLLFPVAVALVWIGLVRGLMPLAKIEARLKKRRPEDLSPLSFRDAPEEIRPLIASFNELMLRLNSNLQTQKRFVADAAHQLKTPLAGLRAQAELAQSGLESERQTSLQNIATGTVQATRLVNQLLALARAEHNAAQRDLTALDLSELARSVTEDSVIEALQNGYDLGLEAECAVPIKGNAILLKELIKNLIDNALRYTPKGSQITVRVLSQNGAARLEVEDNGPGISTAEREKVLEPFYRVLGNTQEGSGLGLAIVRQIAQQHNAEVLLYPNPACVGLANEGLVIAVQFLPPKKEMV